jgi:hypothetical protein
MNDIANDESNWTVAKRVVQRPKVKQTSKPLE